MNILHYSNTSYTSAINRGKEMCLY